MCTVLSLCAYNMFGHPDHYERVQYNASGNMTGLHIRLRVSNVHINRELKLESIKVMVEISVRFCTNRILLKTLLLPGWLDAVEYIYTQRFSDVNNKIIFSSALGIQVRDTAGTLGPPVVGGHTCSSLTIHALCRPAVKCLIVFIHLGLLHYLKISIVCVISAYIGGHC
jgi:hypothetical protein